MKFLATFFLVVASLALSALAGSVVQFNQPSIDQPWFFPMDTRVNMTLLGDKQKDRLVKLLDKEYTLSLQLMYKGKKVVAQMPVANEDLLDGQVSIEQFANQEKKFNEAAVKDGWYRLRLRASTARRFHLDKTLAMSAKFRLWNAGALNGKHLIRSDSTEESSADKIKLDLALNAEKIQKVRTLYIRMFSARSGKQLGSTIKYSLSKDKSDDEPVASIEIPRPTRRQSLFSSKRILVNEPVYIEVSARRGFLKLWTQGVVYRSRMILPACPCTYASNGLTVDQCQCADNCFCVKQHAKQLKKEMKMNKKNGVASTSAGVAAAVGAGVASKSAESKCGLCKAGSECRCTPGATPDAAPVCKCALKEGGCDCTDGNCECGDECTCRVNKLTGEKTCDCGEKECKCSKDAKGVASCKCALKEGGCDCTDGNCECGDGCVCRVNKSTGEKECSCGQEKCSCKKSESGELLCNCANGKFCECTDSCKCFADNELHNAYPVTAPGVSGPKTFREALLTKKCECLGEKDCKCAEQCECRRTKHGEMLCKCGLDEMCECGEECKCYKNDSLHATKKECSCKGDVCQCAAIGAAVAESKLNDQVEEEEEDDMFSEPTDLMSQRGRACECLDPECTKCVPMEESAAQDVEEAEAFDDAEPMDEAETVEEAAEPLDDSGFERAEPPVFEEEEAEPMEDSGFEPAESPVVEEEQMMEEPYPIVPAGYIHEEPAETEVEPLDEPPCVNCKATLCQCSQKSIFSNAIDCKCLNGERCDCTSVCKCFNPNDRFHPMKQRKIDSCGPKGGCVLAMPTEVRDDWLKGTIYDPERKPRSKKNNGNKGKNHRRS